MNYNMTNNKSIYFPYEIWEIVIKELDGKTIASISQGCKLWNSYIKEMTYKTDIWKRVCQKEISTNILSLMLYKINGISNIKDKWFTVYKNWYRWKFIHKHPFRIEEIYSSVSFNIKVTCVEVNGMFGLKLVKKKFKINHFVCTGEFLLIGTNVGFIYRYQNGKFIDKIMIKSQCSIQEILPIIDSTCTPEGLQYQFFFVLCNCNNGDEYLVYCVKNEPFLIISGNILCYSYDTNSIAKLDGEYVHIENITLEKNHLRLTQSTVGRIYNIRDPLSICLSNKKVFIFSKSGVYYTMYDSKNSGYTSVIKEGVISSSGELICGSIFSETIIFLTDVRTLIIKDIHHDETLCIDCNPHLSSITAFILYGNIFIAGDSQGIVHLYDIKKIVSAGNLNSNNLLIDIKITSNPIKKLSVVEDVHGQIIMVVTDNDISFIKWGTNGV